MYYIIYKTTNLINNKYYIGKHAQKTNPHEFDGYFGSNKQLKCDIKTCGKENFKRETLFVFEDETECYLKESDIVDRDFIKRTDIYNMCVGGHAPPERKGKKFRPWTAAEREKLSECKKGSKNPFFGKTRTIQWRQEHSNRLKGRPLSEEHKQNLRKKKSQKHCDNISKGRAGITLTEEHRKHLREAILGRRCYNDGEKNYIIFPNDLRIKELNLILGRINTK